MTTLEDDPINPVVPNCGEPKIGLTKREYFAIMILSGSDTLFTSQREIVTNAIELADQLIEALNTL